MTASENGGSRTRLSFLQPVQIEEPVFVEEEEILPARMAHAVVALRGCTVQEIEVLKVWIKPAFVPILERVLLQPS